MAYDKVIDSEKLNQDLTSIADAIRTSGGTTKPLEFPQGFVKAVEPLVNKEDYLADVFNGDVSELVNSKVATKLPADFQRENRNLIKVDMANATSVGSYCFYNCRSLVSLSLPSATSVGGYGISNCINLEYLYLPSVTTVNEESITSCKKLTSLYLPSLTKINSWGYTFQTNDKLAKAYFPKLTNITGGSFFNCYALETLILGADTVCTLGGSVSNVFGNTKIGNGTGYVYVPSALVEEYKAATNWSAIANQIRAIEDYPEVLEGWE
jgi:hypothetical protein